MFGAQLFPTALLQMSQSLEVDSDLDFVYINLSNIQCLFVTVPNGSAHGHLCGR